jgi:hypothetical protein
MTVLTMWNPAVALPVARERGTTLRRTRLLVARAPARRPLRRWVGRQLVRAGARLANDPTMRPARAR